MRLNIKRLSPVSLVHGGHELRQGLRCQFLSLFGLLVRLRSMHALPVQAARCDGHLCCLVYGAAR